MGLFALAGLLTYVFVGAIVLGSAVVSAMRTARVRFYWIVATGSALLLPLLLNERAPHRSETHALFAYLSSPPLTRHTDRRTFVAIATAEGAMSNVDWYMEGVEVTNCNCDCACPCQFESALPTHGHCRGFAAVRIDNGHFGDVALDGLCAALIYAWPGPIYKGNGECQAVIDEQASVEQRAALAAIMYGKETNEGATHWWVYTKMSSTVHEPLFKRFEFDANIESRQARIVIPGVLESTARPIMSPATGAEHRVRIWLPNGIEFDIAEVAAGTTRTAASVTLELNDSYFHFNAIRQTGRGVVRH